MESPITFVLVHGAWHRSDCWDPLREQIDLLGYESVAPELPAEDLTANFETDAAIVADAIRDHSNVFLVAHSRGVETIPRVLANPQIRAKVVGAAALNSGGPYGIELANEEANKLALPRHNLEFLEAVQWREDGLTEFDATKARELFYSDLHEEQLVSRAIRSLRAQRNPLYDKTPLPPLPKEVPVHYVVGTRDRVLNLERARLISAEWLGKRPIELPFDHTPQLSAPRLLTVKLLQLAIVSRQERISAN